ncbi:MAG: TRAP transporter small permease [Burkholderiaceae bacterium]
MSRIQNLLGAVAGLALFLMMWLTFFDVVGRKFFDNSIVGSVELTELLMMITIFVAMPLTSLAGEHIVFDLFDRVLPDSIAHWQYRIAQGFSALVFAGAAWIVYERAARTLEYGDETAQLMIKLAPFQFLIAVLLMITALVHGWLCLRGADDGSTGARS